MMRLIYFTALLLWFRGAAACDCDSCSSCGCPMPVPVPVTTLVPVPVPGPSTQCPENTTAVWVRDTIIKNTSIIPWEPYQDQAQDSSKFIQKSRGNCGALTQVGGKCDIVCTDDYNKNWTISPYGVLTSSGWGWGEEGKQVGTYCAGFVLSLPYDPMTQSNTTTSNMTTSNTTTPWYNNVHCQVVPSMLCCFRDGFPIDNYPLEVVNPDATPLWSPPPPPPQP